MPRHLQPARCCSRMIWLPFVIFDVGQPTLAWCKRARTRGIPYGKASNIIAAERTGIPPRLERY